jgi:S1-C subfamily serine protease
MVAGRLALAMPSKIVLDFLAKGPSSGWLGITVHPVRIPRANASLKTGHAFGLVILELDPGGPASLASLLPGDILLGTEQQSFSSFDDLARALEGDGPRVLRLDFLRGSYSQVRRVSVQVGLENSRRSSVAA